MKRVLSVILVALMLLTMASCGAKAEALKLGLGMIAVSDGAASADGDVNGSMEVETTAAAVLLNAKGQIVKAVIDTAQTEAAYTAEGKAVASEGFKTKGEKGADYGMAAYGKDLNGDGVVKEWNEQVAAFITLVEGKTIDEVKALVVDGYGTEEVQTAGCTIAIEEFVLALEKAVANAADSAATAEDTLKLGVVVTEETVDATEEKAGSIEHTVTVTAAAVKEGKVVAASSDELIAAASFDTKGAVPGETKALSTKKELGTNYGMAAYGKDLNGDGVVKEWNEQAAAFDAALVGKTATEIGALVTNGYGTEEVQTAGCTIAITNMVAAAVKAATV